MPAQVVLFRGDIDFLQQGSIYHAEHHASNLSTDRRPTYTRRACDLVSVIPRLPLIQPVEDCADRCMHYFVLPIDIRPAPYIEISSATKTVLPIFPALNSS